MNSLLSSKEGPRSLKECERKTKVGRQGLVGGGGRLKEREALVGVLPPGGILNWNAQNNQSHSHGTDVERAPTG